MSLKSWLFGIDDDPVEEKDESVDPIVEERLKEKFSTPLIYDDFQEEEKKEEVKKKKEKKKETKNNSKKDEPYVMHEIISPIYGVRKTEKPKPVKTTTKKKVFKKSDDLIQVISPFYGPEEVNKDTGKTPKQKTKKNDVKASKSNEKVKSNDAKTVKKTKVKQDNTNNAEVIDSVENRLRNIASLTEQSDDDLKIVEERTGQFKLNRKKDEESLIDEIDDNMSMDELMNLYEKRFKD